MTTKRRFLPNWNLDKTLSLMAFLISLGTFFLLYYQTNLTRKQQYASVLPYLEIFNKGPHEEEYTFSVVNNGIGPAFVEEVKVLYEDKEFRMDPVNFIYSEIYPKDTIAGIIHTNLVEGTLIPAGTALDLLQVQGSVKNATKLRELFGAGKARLQIVYTSVYQERWVVTTGNAPQKLD